MDLKQRNAGNVAVKIERDRRVSGETGANRDDIVHDRPRCAHGRIAAFDRDDASAVGCCQTVLSD